MKRTDFRIIKVTYENGTEVYRLQKKTRFCYIGPKVWETYSYFPNHYCDDYGFRYFKWTAVDITSLKDAQSILDDYIISQGWVEKNIKIVREITYE